MLRRVKKWLSHRKSRKEKEDYNRGFDWAAGALLRHEMTPAEVESYYNINSTAEESFSDLQINFIRGVRKAILTLIKTCVVEDDRL